jgi:predicted amidohydrolase
VSATRSAAAVSEGVDAVARIGLIQMQCEKSAIRTNLARIDQHLAQASARNVDIVGFPEMSLTGYADPTHYPEAVVSLDGPEVAQLLRVTEPYPATVLVGLIERNGADKPFITQIVVRQGKLLGAYRKVTIKDEETAWFSPGENVPVFRAGELTFGIAVCADIDNEHVFAQCARQGATIVFELAAPGLYGDRAARNWETGYRWWEAKCQEQLSHYAQAHGLWIAVATQAGRTIDEDFPGGGYVFAPNGQRVHATRDWSPGAEYFTLST